MSFPCSQAGVTDGTTCRSVKVSSNNRLLQYQELDDGRPTLQMRGKNLMSRRILSLVNPSMEFPLNSVQEHSDNSGRNPHSPEPCSRSQSGIKTGKVSQPETKVTADDRMSHSRPRPDPRTLLQLNPERGRRHRMTEPPRSTHFIIEPIGDPPHHLQETGTNPPLFQPAKRHLTKT